MSFEFAQRVRPFVLMMALSMAPSAAYAVDLVCDEEAEEPAALSAQTLSPSQEICIEPGVTITTEDVDHPDDPLYVAPMTTLELSPEPALTPCVKPDCDAFTAEIKKCVPSKYGSLASCVGKCETGNKCTGDIANPSGKYVGAFQFDKTTWGECFTKFPDVMKGCDKSPDGRKDVCCAAKCFAAFVEKGQLSRWPHCGKKCKGQLNCR